MKDSGSFSRPGNVVRVAGNLLAGILLLSVPSIGHASLIDPPWVHAEAAIGQPFVWSDTDEGSKSSASVDSASAVPGYRAFNSIAVSFASLEEAAVDFDRQLSRTASTHPLGCGSEARIFYEAVVDSTADYSWDLDYVFNSGYLNGIIEGGSVWASVQRYDELRVGYRYIAPQWVLPRTTYLLGKTTRVLGLSIWPKAIPIESVWATVER